MQESRFSKFTGESDDTLKLRPILAHELKLAEFAYLAWRVIAGPKTTIEDLMKPESWVHCGRSLHKGSTVGAFAHDGSWYWRAIVRHVEGNAVYLGLIDEVHFGALPEPQTKFRSAKTPPAEAPASTQPS